MFGSRCKNCGHYDPTHNIITGCGFPTFSWSHCRCEKYIPRDNLEFLEWCLDHEVKTNE
jgi:hypothetical protein